MNEYLALAFSASNRDGALSGIYLSALAYDRADHPRNEMYCDLRSVWLLPDFSWILPHYLTEALANRTLR